MNCYKLCKYSSNCFDEHRELSCDGFSIANNTATIADHLLKTLKSTNKVIDNLESIGLNVEDDSNNENSMGKLLYQSMDNTLRALVSVLELPADDKTINYIMSNIMLYDNNPTVFIYKLIKTIY